MRPAYSPIPSVWRVCWDLSWGRLLLWLTQAERRGELRPEVHGFLADCYEQLAEVASAPGWTNADRIAEWARLQAELAAGDDDDPPPACAMGLPRERKRIAVEARGNVVRGPWPGSSRPRTWHPASR